LVKFLEMLLRCPVLVLMFKQKLWCGLTRLLACEWYLDLLCTRLVGIVRWGKTASSCKVVRVIVFSRWQLCCPSAAAVFGQLLSTKVGQFSFECCPLSQRSGLASTSCLVWGGCSVIPPPAVSLCAFTDLCWVLEFPLGD
jgi:hypothetical protein